jgi:D-alanine-D-alanine ligase
MRRSLKVLALLDLVEPPSSADLAKELETEDWITEAHVLDALSSLGHEYSIFGLYDDVRPLIDTITRDKPDVVFNLIEQFDGKRWLDKSVAGILDLLNVPYTGAGTLGLGIARDKALAKKILTYHHVRTPRFAVFHRGKTIKPPKNLVYPLFVKPAREDASEGVTLSSFVKREKQLVERIHFIHESMDCDVIVEEYIDGTEIYCSILGNDRLRVFPLRRLYFERSQAPRFMTFRLKWDSKYQEKWGLMSGFMPDLDADIVREIGRISKRAYRALQLQDYARIDLRLSTEGKPYVIEANPNPYLAWGEDYAESALEGGIDYEELIDRILRLALQRSHASSS